MRIAVTGAAGMLGTALIDALSESHHVFAASRKAGYAKPGVEWRMFDLLDHRLLARWLTVVRPDAVVHCAALVDVDICERRPAEAQSLHADVTRDIADLIAKWNGRLVYISTDLLFSGTKAGMYDESDPPAPRNVYARTKRLGEIAALDYAYGVVLRTNIFGWSRAERYSFAEWVLKGLVERTPLTMFTDVTYTPIHVTHLAAVTSNVLARDLRGLFHASGSTALSKHQFAMQVALAFGLDASNVIATSINDAGLSAPRPKNMALSNARLSEAVGCVLPAVNAGIQLFKHQYDSGWLSAIKSRPVGRDYRFWERE